MIKIKEPKAVIKKDTDIAVVGDLGLKEIWDYTLKEGQLRSFILSKTDTKEFAINKEKNFQIVTSKKELLDFLKLKNCDLNKLKKLLKSLRSKNIDLITTNYVITDGLINNFKIHRYIDEVIIELNPKLNDYFYSKHYVKYYPIISTKFKNKYSLGFYELFKFKIGSFNFINLPIDLNYLYRKFNISDTYKKDFNKLKIKIIDQIIEEINLNTDLKIKFKGKDFYNHNVINFTIKKESVKNKNIKNIKGFGKIYS